MYSTVREHEQSVINISKRGANNIKKIGLHEQRAQTVRDRANKNKTA